MTVNPEQRALQGLLQNLKDFREHRSYNQIDAYRPYPKQKQFHAMGRLRTSAFSPRATSSARPSRERPRLRIMPQGITPAGGKADGGTDPPVGGLVVKTPQLSVTQRRSSFWVI